MCFHNEKVDTQKEDTVKKTLHPNMLHILGNVSKRSSEKLKMFVDPMELKLGDCGCVRTC